jgi:hypothetical protein
MTEMHSCRISTLILSILALVCLSQGGQQAKVQKPVIFIYWQRGMSFEAPPNDLEFAAWSDGRIMWRDTPRRWINVEGKWQWAPGSHFRARIDPSRVSAALRKLRAAKAFAEQDWNLYPPDSSYHRIVVRDGARTVMLSSGREPTESAPYGRDTGPYRRTLKIWKLIRSLESDLRPARGIPIPTPDVTAWR